MPTKMYALHGFLGRPTDWDPIPQGVRESFEALDLFAVAHPSEGLTQWGVAFNGLVAKQPAHKRILLGYSLGGRLAMHALLADPLLWDGAIFISVHTGLPKHERAQRLHTDEQWAQRFLKDRWEEVICDWESQAIFQGGRGCSFQRQERDYERADLAQALIGWSLGKQEDLQEPLSKLPLPIFWVAGEKDCRFVELAKRMVEIHPFSSLWIAPHAGHRVIWECRKLFWEEIVNAMKKS